MLIKTHFKIIALNSWFLLIYSISLFSQNAISRLEDSLKADTLFEKGWALRDIHIDSSMHFANASLQISENNSFDRLCAYGYSLKATCWSALDQYDSAKFYLRMSLNVRLKATDSNDIASVYNNLGLLYNQLEQYDSASYYFKQGLNFLKDDKSLQVKASILNGLSMALLNQQKVIEAEQYLLQSIIIGEQLNDSLGLAKRYQNLGKLYQKINRLQQSLDYYTKAKQIYIEQGNQRGLVDITINEGAILLLQNDYKGAIEKMVEGIELGEEYNFLDDRATLLNNLGYAYLLNNNLKLAEQTFIKGIELAISYQKTRAFVETSLNLARLLVSEGRFEEVVELLKGLNEVITKNDLIQYQRDYLAIQALALSGLGQYKEAYHVQQRYLHLQDSLDEVIDLAQVSLAEMEVNKRDNQLLQQQNQLQQTEIQRQKAQNQNRNLTIVILIILLIGGVSYLLMRNRTIRLKAVALEEKKKSDEKVRTLLTSIDQQMLKTQIETNTETSFKIGQELHDSLGSKLAVVQTYVEGIRKKVTSENSDIEQRFGKVEGLLEESCNDLRSISHDLQNRRLKARALEREIESYTQLINETGAITIHFRKAELPPINSTVQSEVMAVARLLIENVLRHAKASEVNVELKTEQELLVLQVIDNGKGFEYESRQQHGRGIRNAHDRAEKLRGSFELITKVGLGTKAVLRIPLK